MPVLWPLTGLGRGLVEPQEETQLSWAVLPNNARIMPVRI